MSLSKLNVNDLPGKCLVNLFSYMPLHRQLELRLVSQKWNKIITEMCHDKTSLKLFESTNNVINYCQMLLEYGLHDHPQYREFRLYPVGKANDDLVGGKDGPTSDCYFLTELFPNITNLTIDYKSLTSLDVPFLVSRFLKLTSLTVRHVEALPKPVLNAINSNTRIKSLGLLCNNNYSHRTSHLPDRVQMTVLSRVEQFVFAGYGENVVPILRHIGPKIKRLVLAEVNLKIIDWKQLFTKKPTLRKTLTHLTVYDTEAENHRGYEKELFKLVCDHLSSLTSLDLIHFSEVPIDYILIQLAKLSKLDTVRLYVDKVFLKEINSVLNKIKLAPKLTSVKQLELNPLCGGNFHVDHFYPLFSKSMPNLENIIFHTKDAELARQIGMRAASEFDHIQMFTHISPGGYDRGFVGRHSYAYKQYLDGKKKSKYDKQESYSMDDICFIA